ncbi:hypothetical protein, partial [Streptococcus sobrinus]
MMVLIIFSERIVVSSLASGFIMKKMGSVIAFLLVAIMAVLLTLKFFSGQVSHSAPLVLVLIALIVLGKKALA